MMFICVAIFGAATIVFGLSRSLWLSLAALVILGAADMVSVVIRSSLLQLATPPSMRGRVSAVNSLFVGASNELGEYESGLTAQWMGPVRAVVAGRHWVTDGDRPVDDALPVAASRGCVVGGVADAAEKVEQLD